MSRSSRAWTERCALVRSAMGGADRVGTPIVHACLDRRRPLGTARFVTRLGWLAAAAVSLVAWLSIASPAAGESGGRARPGVVENAGGGHLVLDVVARTVATRRAIGPTRDARITTPPLVGLGSGYSDPRGSRLVRLVQKRLARAGYAPGPFDGRYGPLTEQAVMRLQAAVALPVDGVAGPQTLRALASGGAILVAGMGYWPRHRARSVRVLQRRLRSAGYDPGTLDGRYGPLTVRAVMRFQAAVGLPVDGVAGRRTVTRLAAGTWSGQSRPRRPHRALRVRRRGVDSARPLSVTPGSRHGALARPAPLQRARDSHTHWLILWLATLVLVVALFVRRARSEPDSFADGPVAPQPTAGQDDNADRRHASTDRPRGSSQTRRDLAPEVPLTGDLAHRPTQFRPSDHPAPAALRIRVAAARRPKPKEGGNDR